MRKLLLTFFLALSVAGITIAPPTNSFPIIMTTPMHLYDCGNYEPLIEALFIWEANEDPYAYNDLEGATGGLQIRQCRVDHYNYLTKSYYTLADCYDMNISKRIFMYFTNHDNSGNLIPYKSWEQAAKDWNGSGPMTETYWENVKKLL